eukprot:jgi/Astpho2/9096/Aster-x0384
MQATFTNDGGMKKGETVQTAEGLGGVNIKGTQDPKTKVDAEADTGKKEVNPSPTANAPGPAIGTDAASKFVATAEHPESGRPETSGNVTVPKKD